MIATKAGLSLLAHVLLAFAQAASFITFMALNSTAHLLDGSYLMVAYIAYVAGNSVHAISVALGPSGVSVQTVTEPPGKVGGGA